MAIVLSGARYWVAVFAITFDNQVEWKGIMLLPCDDRAVLAIAARIRHNGWGAELRPPLTRYRYLDQTRARRACGVAGHNLRRTTCAF